MVEDGEEETIMHMYDLADMMSSEKLKYIYQEENEATKKFLIKTYVECLKTSTKGKKAYEYSYKLRKYFGSSDYRNLIELETDNLYNRISFPVDDVDKDSYYTCYNIMYVLYYSDADKFLRYCDKIKKECDNMSRHRIEVVVKEIMKSYERNGF